MPKLVGTCNLCGGCCLGKDGSRCEHLTIISAIGLPFGATCSVYNKRYDAMPIAMIAKDGSRIEGKYHCALNSPAETQAIIEQGINKGICSLRLEE